MILKSKQTSYYHIFFICLSLYISINFFLKNEISKYFYILLIVGFIKVVYFHFERRLYKIILEEDKELVSFIFTSGFRRKPETNKYNIKEIDCQVYDKLIGNNGYRYFFKILKNNELIEDMYLSDTGFSRHQLEELTEYIKLFKEKNENT